MPVSTIRAWVIGAVLCTIVAACNILLSLRRAPIAITSTVVQLVAYPCVHAILTMQRFEATAG